MDTVVSGIQRSRLLHLGSDLSAVRTGVALQGTWECSFCIVDLHAVTRTPAAA